MEDLTIIHVIAGIAIFLTIFLLLRELVCWYFKINERMKIQQETNILLGKVLKALNPEGENINQIKT